jgi:Flp pilus assembly protein TadD
MSPKQKILAALAALSITSCTESKPVAAPQPVVPSKTVVVLKPTVLEVIDAGAAVTRAPEELAPVDALIVAHDTPTVDHLGRAKQLSTEGDVKGALLEARRALFTTPSDAETLTLVARLSRRAGQPELAAEAWGRVAQQGSDDATPLIQQARAFMAMKDAAGAVMAGREASARDPGNAEAFHVTGLAQLSMGELGGAIASFEKTVELEPNHGWALNNLGFACLRANRNERAVEVLERAAEQLPHVASVQNNYGVALERVGRKDEAKAAYQHAMDLSPKYVKARLNSARVAKAPAGGDDAQVVDDGLDGAHPLPEPR